MYAWIKRDAQAGRGLIEMLIVALFVGLIAAAVIPNIPGFPKPSTKDAASLGAPNLQQALAQLLGDPEAAASGAVVTPLDSAEDRQAYETLVQELESAQLLEEWQRLLESRLAADHPLLTALTTKELQSARMGENDTRQSQEIPDSPIWQSEQPGQEWEDDPEMSWSDGEPVIVLEEKP